MDSTFRDSLSEGVYKVETSGGLVYELSEGYEDDDEDDYIIVSGFSVCYELKDLLKELKTLFPDEYRTVLDL